MYNCSPDYELRYQDAMRENAKLIKALKNIYNIALDDDRDSRTVRDDIISMVVKAMEDKKDG